MVPVAIVTNVFVAGLRSGGCASRQTLRLAIGGAYVPLFSNALWLEYEDVDTFRRLGQSGAADKPIFARLDLGTKPRNGPMWPVGHRRFEQGGNHPQRRADCSLAQASAHRWPVQGLLRRRSTLRSPTRPNHI